MAAIIETVRDWIAGCPLVEENAILGVDRLGADPIGYTVDTVPCDPVASQYVDGSQRRQFLFVFASRNLYSDTAQNLTNSAFYDDYPTGSQGRTSCGSCRNLAHTAQHSVWKLSQADTYMMPATVRHGIRFN